MSEPQRNGLFAITVAVLLGLSLLQPALEASREQVPRVAVAKVSR